MSLDTLRDYATLDGDALASVWMEIDRLRATEAAARNLVAQKGRHHTELAYKRLVEVLTPNAKVSGTAAASSPQAPLD